MTITFDTEVAADDETWLSMYQDGTYVGQVDFCVGDPYVDAPDDEDEATLAVWRLLVVEDHRGERLTRPLLTELRRRHPDARWLHLDVGTAAAHRVVQSWLGLPKSSEQLDRYPLAAAASAA